MLFITYENYIFDSFHIISMTYKTQKIRRSTTTAVLLTASILLASQTLIGSSSNNASAISGGTVVLMGIDAEDGSPFDFHGPIGTYTTLGGNIHSTVSNGATGLLVFGCDGGLNDSTFFWTQIATAISEPLTCVNTPAAIAALPIPSGAGGYAMIGVAGSTFGNFDGSGLSDAASDALMLRQASIASHVNAGGALWGMSQDGQTNPYGYLGGIGAFTTTTGNSYDNITATAAGSTIGIDNSLDVFAWHDTYVVFPAFLSVLATVECNLSSCSGVAQDDIAAIGGQNVIITSEGCSHGYWKSNANHHEAASWTNYAPVDDFDTVFVVDISIKWADKGKPQNTDDFSLIQALEANGDGLNTLARDGTAALLNANNANIGYPFSDADVKAIVQAAVAEWNANGNSDAFNDLLNQLIDANLQVCPINQAGQLPPPPV
jgi:hypothetical protein